VSLFTSGVLGLGIGLVILTSVLVV